MPNGTTGFGGGGEIASAFVTIGANLQPLEEAEQRVRAIVERLGNLSSGGIGGGGNIGTGSPVGGVGVGFSVAGASPNYGTVGGTFTATPNMGVISALPNVSSSGIISPNVSSAGGMAGSAVSQAIASAVQAQVAQATAQVEQQVAAQIESQFASSRIQGVGGFGGAAMGQGRMYHARPNLGDFPAVRPMGLEAGEAFVRPEPEAATTAFAENLAARRAAASAEINDLLAGGGPPGGGGPSRMFGLRGALAQATGIPYAGVLATGLAVRTAGEVARGFETASYIGAHGELALNRLGEAGSGLGLVNDPTVVGLAAQSNELERRLAVRSAVNSLPLMSAFDVGPDSSFQMRQEQARIGERISGLAATANIRLSAANINARLGGDEEMIYRQSQARDLAAAREQVEVSERRARLAGGELLRDQAANYRSAQAGQLAGQSPVGAMAGLMVEGPHKGDLSGDVQNWLQLSDAAQKARDALYSLTGSVEATAQRIGVAQWNAINLAGAEAQGQNILATGGTPLQALRVRQRAEVTAAFDTFEVTPMTDAFGVPTTGFIEALGNLENVSARHRLETELAQRREQGARTMAAAVGLRGRRMAFEAGQEEIQAQIDAALPGDPETEVLRQSLTTNRALYGRGLLMSMGEMSAGYTAAAGRVNQDPFAQGRSLREQAANQRAYNPDARAGEVEAARLTGMAALADIEARNQTFLERESYGAQVAVASETMQYHPIAASIEGEIARGRAMIHAASAGEKANARAAAAADLQARMHDLTAPRGGLTAIDMSAHEAMGVAGLRGLDLSGRAADIRRARERSGRALAQGGDFDNAVNDLEKAPSGIGGALDDQSKQALQDIRRMFNELLRKAGTISMFN